MTKKIQNRIAFAVFVVLGLLLLHNFGLYFVMSVPILFIIYVLIIKFKN